MTGIIISGPARCGKNSLVNHITNKDICVLKLDALIRGFQKSNKKIERKLFLNFIKKYLENPRYQDSYKKKKNFPYEYVKLSADKILKKINFSKLSSSQLIISIFDSWIKLKKKKYWIVPDLNAEIYCQELFQFKSNLFVIFIFRNPIEAITASLYWRTYPKKNNSFAFFIYKIILWNLSYFISVRIKNKMPDSVDIINYENFFVDLKKNKLIKKFNLKLKKFNNDDTFFNFKNSKGWLCPDGKYRNLLSENEKNLIQSTCLDHKYKIKNKSYISYIISFLIIIFTSIAKTNVNTSRKILDFFFFPKLTIKSFFLNILIIKKMRFFLKRLSIEK